MLQRILRGHLPTREEILSLNCENSRMAAKRDYFLNNFESVWENLHSYRAKAYIFKDLPVFIRITSPDLMHRKFSQVFRKGIRHFVFIHSRVYSLQDEPDYRAILQQFIPVAVFLVRIFSSCVKAMRKGMTLLQVQSFPTLYLFILLSSYKFFVIGPVPCYLKSFSECNELWNSIKEFEQIVEEYLLSGIKIGPQENVKVMRYFFSNILEFLHIITMKGFYCISVVYRFWRMFVRLIVLHYKSDEEVDVSLAVYLLSWRTLQSLEEFCRSVNTKPVVQVDEIKECSSFLKLLIIMCGKCNGFSSAFRNLQFIIIELYGFFLSWNSSEKKKRHHVQLDKWIFENLSSNVDTLVFNLLKEPRFYDCMLNIAAQEAPIKVSVIFCLMKLRLLLLNPSDDVRMCTLAHFKWNIINSLLNNMSTYAKEAISSCGVCEDWSGNFPRIVPFYDYMLQRLCTFFSKTSADCIGLLERFLLSCLLSDAEFINFLACDVWCFLVRYGPLEICYDHDLMLAKVLHMLIDLNKKSWIHILLQRLYNLLSPFHKREFIKKCRHLPIGQSCNIPNISTSSFFLTNFRAGKAMTRLYKLHAFISSNAFPEVVKNMFNSKLDLALLESAICLLPSLPLISESDYRRIKVALNLATHLWNSQNMSVQLAVLTLLTSLVKMNITANISVPLKEGILNKFLSLLLKSLKHPDSKIQMESLSLFLMLSFFSPHAAFVKQCLGNSSMPRSLKLLFRKYLQIPYHCEPAYSNTSLLLQQRPGCITRYDDFILYLCQGTTHDDMAMETSELEDAVALLNQAREKICTLENMPSWAKGKIYSICQQIIGADESL